MGVDRGPAREASRWRRALETNKGDERRTLEMWEDESVAEFAERVRETIVDLTEMVLG